MTPIKQQKAGMVNQMFQPWLICVIAMIFYCYNYFLRVSPSTMQADLTQTFHITATQFGTLAACYYWAYTPMQLPAGIIYDKFGSRFVLFFACLLAVLGLSIFIAADTLLSAGTGRFLIGLGCAFAYIGVLKLASVWLPANRFATVAGLTTALGMTSAALSQKYLTHLVETIGYKNALHTALFLGVALSIVILFLVRSRPKQKAAETSEMQSPMSFRQLGSAILIIFTNPQMWLIGLIGCLLYLPASVFLDLWGTSYLKVAHMLSSDEAANISGITFLGWIISGPIIGMFSDKIKRRRAPLVITGALAATFLCIIFYVPNLTIKQLYILFFATGFCCGSHPLCFALGKENNPAPISGTAVAVTNMLIMLGGLVFQPVVGKLLDLHTNGTIGADGLPIYSASDYTFALSVVPLGVALGIIVSMFVKETHCESQAKESDERIFSPASASADDLVPEGSPS